MKKFLIATFTLCFGIVSFAQTEKIEIHNDSLFIDGEAKGSISHLDLSSKALERLPRNLNDFSQIKTVDLSDNRLKNIKGIAQLKQLEELVLDHNPNLMASSFNGELDQLDSLRKLSIRYSKLLYIPYSVYKLHALEELNLEHNEIELISFEIGNLSQLKSLNLSHNQITFIDKGIQSLRNLEQLNVSGNSILQAEHFLLQLSTLNQLTELQMDAVEIMEDPVLLQSVKKLTLNQNERLEQPFILQAFTAIEELTINSDRREAELAAILKSLDTKTLRSLELNNSKIQSVPLNLDELRKLETLKLSCENLKSMPAEINRLKHLKVIGLYSIQLNWSSTIAKLIPLKKLEMLQLSDHNMKELPNALSSLRELKELKIATKSIAQLPKSMKNLEQLERFEMEVIDTEIANLEYLKTEMPDCNFVIHSVISQNQSQVLQPPLAAADIDFDEYYISTSKAQTLTTPSGSQLFIPENAFLNKAGEVVKGKVEVVYREFADPIDMALAGVPMTETQKGETYTYSSAGMMEFRAYQNDEELFPNPDQLISINYNSPFQGDNYDLFYLDPEEEKWENIGKDSISQSSNDFTTSIKPLEWKTAPERPEIPSFPYRKSKLNLSVRYNKKYKNTYLYLYADQQSRRGKRDTTNKVFSDLKYFSKSKWKIDDTDPKKKRIELEKLAERMSLYNARANWVGRRNSASTYSWGQLNYLEDFWLEPNAEHDNFHLVLSLSGELIKIPIIPLNLPKRPETAQRKVKRIHNNYHKNLKKRKADWEKIDTKFGIEVDNYNSSMASYEQEMVAYRKAIEDYNRIELEELKTFPATESNVVRSFTLSSFGVFNCDIINRMEQPRQLLATLTDENGNELNTEKIYVMDKVNNGLLTFDDPDKAFFEYRHTNSLIAILPNEKIAVLNSQQFDADRLMQKGSEAKLKVFDMKTTSVADLRKNAEFF